MEEKYSREEKNSNLYIEDDHKLRILIYYILMPLFILLSMFAILTDNVHAKEVTNNMNSAGQIYTYSCGATAGPSSNKWCSYTQGVTNAYVVKSFNTTYNGVINGVDFCIDGINRSLTHRISINAMSTDFRNSSNFYVGVTASNSKTSGFTAIGHAYKFVSKSKIEVTIYPDSYSYHCVSIEGFPLTGVSTYGIKSITDTFDDGTGDNSDIIETNNKNTEDIINNNNSNTQDIIDNNSNNTNAIISNNQSNTEQILVGLGSLGQDISGDLTATREEILSNTTCPVGPWQFSYAEWVLLPNFKLDNEGNEVSANSSGISPYFPVKPSTSYEFIYKNGSYSGSSFCFYTTDRTLISCLPHSGDNITFDTPKQTAFIRFTLSTSRAFALKGPLCNLEKMLDDLRADIANGKLDAVSDKITDDNVSGDIATSFFEDFENTDFHGISQILTKPLVLVNNMLSSSNSCSSLQTSVTIPSIGSYGGSTTNIELPSGCVLWNRVPNAIVTTWHAFTIGLASYFILKDLLLLSEKLESPSDNKTEVMKL